MKKLLHITLALVLALSCLSLTALADRPLLEHLKEMHQYLEARKR